MIWLYIIITNHEVELDVDVWQNGNLRKRLASKQLLM